MTATATAQPAAQVHATTPLPALRWSTDALVALFELPFNDLLFRAQEVHREHHQPNAVQLSTLLSIKTGGCSEDCGYCSQSAHHGEAERGFNQALELARPLARSCGAPLDIRHVRRHRDTTPQASLPWKERAKNIRHAFECDIDLAGMNVLIVDDVMTTGATLDELARTLKAHGANRVENRVLARALKD